MSLALATPLGEVRSCVPSEVRAGPGRVEWSIARSWWVEGKTAADCFWTFLRLATEEDDEAYVRFAQDFGVLGLGTDGLPITDWRSAGPGPVVAGDPLWHWEPIEAWRVWARNARALVALSVALKGDRRIDAARVVQEAGLTIEPMPGTDDDEPILQCLPYVETYADGSRGLSNYWLNLNTRLTVRHIVENVGHYLALADQRQSFGGVVGAMWLQYGGLDPLLIWDGDEPGLTLGLSDRRGGEHRGYTPWPLDGGRPLFSVLAAHLAAVVCSNQTVNHCHNPTCGVPYLAARRGFGYCAPCRREAEKARKRKSAAKRRAADRKT